MSEQKVDALRFAADVLERANRSGVEVDVAWWWLRDRADEQHITTDPLCVLYVAPETKVRRAKFDRMRGVPCKACIPTSEVRDV